MVLLLRLISYYKYIYLRLNAFLVMLMFVSDDHHQHHSHSMLNCAPTHSFNKRIQMHSGFHSFSNARDQIFMHAEIHSYIYIFFDDICRDAINYDSDNGIKLSTSHEIYIYTILTK